MPRTSPSGSGTQPWTCSHVSSDADRRRERTSVVALANSGFMKHLNLVSIKPAAAHTDCKPPFARQRRPQASEVGLLSSFFASTECGAQVASDRSYGAHWIWHDPLASGSECGPRIKSREADRVRKKARPRPWRYMPDTTQRSCQSIRDHGNTRHASPATSASNYTLCTTSRM
jgi:hypothetical protein